MLFLSSTSYDPQSRVLTARFRAPSGTAWAAYQYRDVPADLVEEMRAARPHGQQVLEERIAPRHAVRRVGATTWQAAPADREPSYS